MRFTRSSALILVTASVLVGGLFSPASAKSKPSPAPPPAPATPLNCVGNADTGGEPPGPGMVLAGHCDLLRGGRAALDLFASVDTSTDPPTPNGFGAAFFWVENSGMVGQRLREVKNFSYAYRVTERQSLEFPVPEVWFGSAVIPLDIDGNGTIDGLINAVTSSGGLGSPESCVLDGDEDAGVVDLVNAPSCQLGVAITGGGDPVIEQYTTWSDLVAAHPDWRVAQGDFQVPGNEVRPVFSAFLSPVKAVVSNVRMGSAHGSTIG